MSICSRCGADERYAKGGCAPCGRSRSYRARLSVVEALGAECVQCGFTDTRALEIDHIHDNGAEHRAAKGRGSPYYKSMLDNLDEYQVLCSNCNQIKRHDKISGT